MTARVLLVVAASLLVLAQPAVAAREESCDKNVCIIVMQRPARAEVIARNDRVYDVTITFELTGRVPDESECERVRVAREGRVVEIKRPAPGVELTGVVVHTTMVPTVSTAFPGVDSCECPRGSSSGEAMC